MDRDYDLDLDAIDENDAAADGGDDEDALMPDAEQPVVAIVASHVVDAPAAAVDALDVSALPHFAATPTARDAFSASRLAFIAAAPSRAFVARGAADDGLDTTSLLDLGDCGEQPFAATASAGPALQALHAQCPTLALAPTSFLRRLASDRDARVRVAAALAPSTTRDTATGRRFGSFASDAPALYGGWDAGDVSDVYDATAGTVLDRSRALSFAGDARTISLLLAAGADVSRSGVHNASGDDGPLHLFAGALDPTSTEADPPDGAEPADGSTDAVDANGAAVSTTTTTAAQSDLDPALKTRYEGLLATLKDYRKNGYDGCLLEELKKLTKGLKTPGGEPMGNLGKYMTGRYWEKEPGKKKPSKLFLTGPVFLKALITELEAFLGLEPSTVEALDDDDDDAEEAVPEASLAEAKRWLLNMKVGGNYLPQRLKELCAQFKVDYSELGNDRAKIRRVLVARLKEIVADGDEEMSVDKRAKAVMAAIAMEAKGSGLDADDLEFCRVLWTVLCAGRPPPVEIELRDDFLSAALAGLREELPSLELPDVPTPEEAPVSKDAVPSPSLDAPLVSEEAASSPPCEEPALEEAAPSPRPEKVQRASTFVLKREVSDEIWKGLDGNAADALRVTSRAAHAVVPDRLALSMAVRRHTAVDEKTDPKSHLTMLMADFVAVDVKAPFPEVLAKVDKIAENLFLRPGKNTVHEGMEGRLSTPGALMRRIANNVGHAALELKQLCLPKSQRDPFFKTWTNDDVGCTIDTQIKAHSVVKLLEHYVDAVLAGETKHDLDEVVSVPSSKVKVTLKTSLGTWRDVSADLRKIFMGQIKTIPGRVDYGDARKHSTPAAITIIRDASVAIEAQLAELTKDYPAEFDKAIEFFLERFKPKDDAEAAEAAAWRSWLENPMHVVSNEQKATGEVKKKVKRAEIGRAKAPKSRSKKKKH